jgi:hypothetical protein
MFSRLAQLGIARVAQDLAADFPRFSRILPAIHSSAKVGVEGMLVAFADILAVVAKVRDELTRGNRTVLPKVAQTAYQLFEFQTTVRKTGLLPEVIVRYLDDLASDAVDIIKSLEE